MLWHAGALPYIAATYWFDGMNGTQPCRAGYTWHYRLTPLGYLTYPDYTLAPECKTLGQPCSDFPSSPTWSQSRQGCFGCVGGYQVPINIFNFGDVPSIWPVLCFAIALPPSATTTALESSLNSLEVGEEITFTAMVTGVTPTGIVTFKDGNQTVLGNGTLDGTGRTTFATSSLNVGNHAITATYDGDANNDASTSSALNVTVSQRLSNLNITSSANPAMMDQSVTFTATVRGYAPTGTITFKEGQLILAAVALNGTTATHELSTLSIGRHFIRAEYDGDINNQASTSSPPFEQIVLTRSNVVLISSPHPSSVGETVTFTAAVAGTGPTGTVTFKDVDSDTSLGLGTLNEGAIAILQTSVLRKGNHSIVAVYGGDGNNAPSVSSPLAQMVTTRSAASRCWGNHWYSYLVSYMNTSNR